MKPTYQTATYIHIHVIDTTASLTNSCFILPICPIPNIFTITFPPTFIGTTKRFSFWFLVFVTSLVSPLTTSITTHSVDIWFWFSLKWINKNSINELLKFTGQVHYGPSYVLGKTPWKDPEMGLEESEGSFQVKDALERPLRPLYPPPSRFFPWDIIDGP